MLKLEEYLDRNHPHCRVANANVLRSDGRLCESPKPSCLMNPCPIWMPHCAGETRIEIASLHKSLGATMIYVTHDQVEAMTLADRIVAMNKGQIMQVGSPQELYERPGNTFVAQFLGSPKMNVIGSIRTRRGDIKLPGNRCLELSAGNSETIRQWEFAPNKSQ